MNSFWNTEADFFLEEDDFYCFNCLGDEASLDIFIDKETLDSSYALILGDEYVIGDKNNHVSEDVILTKGNEFLESVIGEYATLTKDQIMEMTYSASSQVTSEYNDLGTDTRTGMPWDQTEDMDWDENEKLDESRRRPGRRLNERKTYSVFADVGRGGHVEYRYTGTKDEARQFAESLDKRTFKGYQIIDPDRRMLKESELPVNLSNYRAKFVGTGFEPVDEIVKELGFEEGMEYDLKDIALRLFDGMVNTEEWTFGAEPDDTDADEPQIDIMVFDEDGDKVGDLFFEITTEVDESTMTVIFDKLNDMLVNGN